MTGNTAESIDQTTRLMRNAAWVFFIVILSALAILAVYIGNFQNYPKAQTTDVWGQVGDFFGGVLNPIVGIATIYLILISIRMQKQELLLTREELKSSSEALEAQARAINLQAFEQSFFSWLSNYRNLVNSVSATTSRYADEQNIRGILASMADTPPRTRAFIQLSGLNALAHIWDYESSGKESFDVNEKVEIIKRIEKDSALSTVEKNENISEMIVALNKTNDEEWESFYSENGYQVDGLFRTLLGLIDWIDKHETLSKDKKWLYVGIVKAQLSQLELHLLFFFGMSQSGQIYRLLYEKFALFSDLRFDRIISCLRRYRHLDKASYRFSAFDLFTAKFEYPETRSKSASSP